MASGKCTYFRTIIESALFNQYVWTPPTVLYVALSSSAFAATTDGNIILSSEVPQANGYARVAVDATSAEWAVASDGYTMHNVNPIQFPDVTSPWSVSSVYLLDGNSYTSSDNVLAGYDLTTPGTIAVGSGPSIAAGAFLYQEN